MRPHPYKGLTPLQVARRIVAPVLFVGALFYGVLTYERPAPPVAPGAEAARPTTAFEGQALGTDFVVRIAGTALDEAGEQAVAAAVAEELTEVDRLMSTWKADSELSRLNRAEVGVPFALSGETRAVLDHAAAIAEASGGALDVTVGPLVRAWGFGAGAAASPPSAEDLESLRAVVGWRKLLLDDAGATRTVEGLTVDLSAIAKGWAVDEVSRRLTALGHPEHMVEVGGEVRAHGRNAAGQPWRIAIEQPDALRRSPHAVVALDGLAMATSGDYRSYREVDGQRISHTIDPRTGRPATHRLASVTVLAPTCVEADGWATALMALGPEEGLRLAEEQGLAAYFLVRTDEGFAGRPTPSFPTTEGGAG
jgi:thiamine biosynthesis lipoprotein